MGLENKTSARIQTPAPAYYCNSFYMKIISAFTTSLTRSRMLFIMRTHFIGFSALSCSVTPSFPAYFFTSRRKSACASSSTSARWEVEFAGSEQIVVQDFVVLLQISKPTLSPYVDRAFFFGGYRYIRQTVIAL